MSFAAIAADLQRALARDAAQIRLLMRRSPAMAYRRIVEIGAGVGGSHGVQLVVNFPKRGRIEEFAMYGRRDLSVIVDKEARTFPVPRSTVKAEAERRLSGVRAEDAYMYEGKEGVKVHHDGGRIDVLPHSMHVWCELDEAVTSYCDWLMDNVYARRR